MPGFFCRGFEPKEKTMANEKFTTKNLTRAAMIAALYTVLTLLLQPISFGQFQFRISEALTLLPLLLPEAIPGLTAGCLLANLLGGAVWFDVAFGTIATLLSALATRRLRRKPQLAAAMPALFNGMIVGPIVYFGYVWAPGSAVMPLVLAATVASVAAGEIAVCYTLGQLLIHSLAHKKLLIHP